MINKEISTYAGFATDNKYIWYITDQECFLMQIFIETGTVKCLGKIPETHRPYTYRTLVYCCNSLYCVPYYTNKICRYDLSANKFEMINMPEDVCNDYTECMLFGNFINNEEIVMYGKYPYIVRYNWVNGRFYVHHLNEKDLNINHKIDHWFFRDGFELNNKYIIPIHHYSIFLIIDTETNKTKAFVLNGQENYIQYSITRKYKDNICALTINENHEMKIYFININNGTIEKENIYRQEQCVCENQKDSPFLWGDILEDKFILLPGYQKNACTINLSDSRININSTWIDNDDNEKRYFFCGIKINDIDIMTIYSCSNELVVINRDANVQYKKVVMESESEKYIQKYFENKFNSKEIVIESDSSFDLKYLINYRDKAGDDAASHYEESIGSKIWGYITRKYF
jgi:hypothetical protein